MSTDTALVVIDAQIGVVGEAYHHDEVLSNIQLLLGRARSSGTPVLYVQHNERGGMEKGEPLWQIHPAVTPREGEPVIQKESPDSFHETRLQEELEARGIKSLVITGARHRCVSIQPSAGQLLRATTCCWPAMLIPPRIARPCRRKTLSRSITRRSMASGQVTAECGYSQLARFILLCSRAFADKSRQTRENRISITPGTCFLDRTPLMEPLI